MRPSLHYGMRGGDIEGTVRLCRDADVWDLVCDAKQITGSDAYEPLAKPALDAFKAPFEAEGIHLSAVTVGWLSRDAEGRPEGSEVDRLCGDIGVLGEGGVPIAQVFDMCRVPEGADRARYVAGLHESYRPIVKACAEAGVKLAIHASWLPEYALWNTETLMALFRAVPDPHNGVCFCVGSYWQSGDDVVESVRRFGDRIHYVHLRDAETVGANCPELLLGKGKVPFAAVTRALREIGYDGPVHCEHFGSFAGERGGEMSAAFAVGFMRGLFQAR